MELGGPVKARCAVALVMLLALSPAAALAAVPGAPQPDASDPGAAPARAADPPGCVVEAAHALCRWTIDTRPPRVGPEQARFDVPAFERTLARVTVVFQGEDGGWAVDLYSFVENQSRVSRATHEPPATPATEARSTSDHLLPGGPADVHRLLFSASYRSFAAAGAQGSTNSTTGAPALSVGVFTLVYDAVPLPNGTPPARPAASRDFPQIVGRPHDARNASVDMLAAWIDDAALGDAVIDAHFALADLHAVDFSSPADPTGRVTIDAIHYDLHFKVLGVQYLVEISARPNGEGANVSWSSHLLRNESGSWQDVAALIPEVDVDAGTLTVVFPEDAIGAPGAGDAFEEMNVNVDSEYAIGGYRQQDDAGVARFPFALGGPVVWDQLNGCHFCPPPTHWWQDPLASDNLPNTVQVGGAIVAVIAFFGGLLLLRRRRAKVRELLRLIDRTETAHERNTREALLALGALDSKFADMYHKGDLNDDQYQVVAQRLAMAATRFALRQGLGLDDGAAGDRSLPSADAAADAPSVARDRDAARTIPVQGEPRSEVRRS